MRVNFLQLGILVTLTGLASVAQAATPASEPARAPDTAHHIERPMCDGAGSVQWITEMLLRGVDGPGHDGRAAAIEVVDADHMRSAKPHQNPAFPAAFVFQSNSALYLAFGTPSRNERSRPTGS